MPKSTPVTEETPVLRPNSARQRNPATKPKKNTLPALPLPRDYRPVKFVDSPESNMAAEALVARIHELEDRLSQQAVILAERCAELAALKTETHAITALRNHIREQDVVIQSKEIALSEIEQSFEAEVGRVQAQLAAQNQILASREVELDQLKGLLQGQRTTVLPSQNTIHWVAAETERLIAEQREAKLGLAKLEMDEWCTIRRRNAWKRLVAAIRGWFDKACLLAKRSR